MVGAGPRAGRDGVLRSLRMAYPLSLRLVRDRVPGLGRLIPRLDVASRAVQRRHLALPRYLSVFPGQRFGEEFDDLWARSAANHGVLTVRDSRYLTWRVIDTPTPGRCGPRLRARGGRGRCGAFRIAARG